LVGGTALALQIGHRKSDDIDLFGILDADEFEVSEALNKIGRVATLSKTANISVYLLEGIKVDIVNYKYPWLEGAYSIDNLTLASLPDIAAMKLAAITGRGTKKDFVDLYFLLQHYSLHKMIRYYGKKFHDGSEFMVLKSLTYFDDADEDAMPVMLQVVDWTDVKNSISTRVRKYPNDDK
jgi:hypothetical protein